MNIALGRRLHVFGSIEKHFYSIGFRKNIGRRYQRRM
jgi:hypothetical protein